MDYCFQNEMDYCFHLYTPDLKEQDFGKFTACAKIFFNNESPITPTVIKFCENSYFDKKYIHIYGSCYFLDENACEIADEYSETTFFTDFLKKHNCSGMIIRIT